MKKLILKLDILLMFMMFIAIMVSLMVVFTGTVSEYKTLFYITGSILIASFIGLIVNHLFLRKDNF